MKFRDELRLWQPELNATAPSQGIVRREKLYSLNRMRNRMHLAWWILPLAVRFYGIIHRSVVVLIGGSAMSAFRVEALLSKCPELSQLSARTIYFVDGKLTPDSSAHLQELLAAEVANDISPELITVPRAGTISPWASKATDIAHNCGLHDVRNSFCR